MTDELHIHEFQQPGDAPQKRQLPVWAWGGIAVVVIMAVAAIVLFVVPGIAAGRGGAGSISATLNDGSPSLYHADGLAVALADGGQADVTVSTTPREAFLDGAAGREWVDAYAALPSGYTALSPIYSISVRGDAALTAEMAVPNGAEPLEHLDLYRWDAGAGAWVFVPSQLDSARQVVTFSPQAPSAHVMAFKAAGSTPALGMVVTSGGPDLSGATYSVALPEGLAVDEAGSLGGTPAEASATSVLPIVENRAGGFTAYADTQAPVIGQLVEAAAPYGGLTLDFAPAEGYTQFVAALAEQLHAGGKQLNVILRTSDLAGIDIALLGQHADRVWISPTDDPAAYLSGNTVDQMLSVLVGQVERRKLGLLTSALHVDITPEGSRRVSFEEAAGPLGGVAAAEGYLGGDGSSLAAAGTLPLRLDGSAESLGYDSALKVNYLTYRDEAGALHHVYFTSAASLQARLQLARKYALSAAAIHGLAHPDAPAELADGLTALLSEQPLGDPQPLELVWQVRDGSGAELSREQGDLSLLQFVWEAPSDPGAYAVAAALSDGSQTSERGELGVQVVAATDPTGTPTPPPTQAPSDDPTPAVTPEPDDDDEDEVEPTPPADAPPPPVAPSGVGGGFELGGQVSGGIYHPNEMRQAGMSWAKFQIKWSPGADPAGAAGYIGQAHANGFKVLLSIPGPLYPTSIDYNSYVEYLRQVASYGPDAIEIWNEMNLNREWPAGQIDPTVYVNNMLAPAFNAIKSVSPGTMVIIGALAPTGVDDGVNVWSDQRYVQGLAAAGAASYADCLGVHHNAGATPPSASTGHPAGGHYSWYFQPTINVYSGGMGGALPLCFTEFGYVSGEGYGELPGNWSWGSHITVADQAAWLAEGVQIARSLGYVRLMIIWNVDLTYWGDDPQAGYAIVRPDGSCPACGTLGAAMQ